MLAAVLKTTFWQVSTFSFYKLKTEIKFDMRKASTRMSWDCHCFVTWRRIDSATIAERLELTWIQHVSTADLRLEKVKLHLKNPWTDRGNKLESLTVCYCDHWIIKSDLYNLPGLFSSNLCDSRLRNPVRYSDEKKNKRVCAIKPLSIQKFLRNSGCAVWQ